jgi:hypothetical protein
MQLLIYSGLLYLMGISIILVLKPKLMFSDDGSWKEFGIGRNKHRYTWMPFWLFAIMWAIISYIIVLIMIGESVQSPIPSISTNISPIPVADDIIQSENLSTKPLSNIVPKKKTASEMKPGYYILDAQETAKKGIPKYIYLGPEAPNLIFNNTDLE